MHQSSRSAPATVRRRQVFHLAGYDPVLPQEHYGRFVRQLEIFQRTWGVKAQASAAKERDGLWAWTVEASGPGWQVHSSHELWVWDDIVWEDAARPTCRRLADAAATYGEFLCNGTIVRYVKANARYFLFAVVPPLEVIAFAALALWAGWLVARAAGLGGFAAFAVTVAVGVVGFFLLMRWPGRRFRVEQALDDWIFCRDYVRGRRPDVESRMDRFADLLIACARAGAVDEIVVVGHSFGASFAMDLVARALARDPELGRHGPQINILTVGATIPKCTLHPAADGLRAAVARVAQEPSIHWAEFQSRGDAISFYRFDPVSLRKVDGDRIDGRPVIRRVQIHDMVQPETYARFKMRVLRMHYQSVSANDRHALYDYFMLTCGPVPFAAWTVSPQGLLDFVATDGSVKAGVAAP